MRARMVRAFGVDDWFMLLATIMFILFVTCVNVGVHYGTGRHYADLALSDFENAMQVSFPRPHEMALNVADPDISTVLVLLLHLVLLDHDLLQDLNWNLPPAHHRRAHSGLVHLHRPGHQCYDRTGVFLCHHASVPASLILLAQGTNRQMYSNRHHHRPHVSLFEPQHNLRLHVRPTAYLHRPQAQHEAENEGSHHTVAQHGLHRQFSRCRPSLLRRDIQEPRFSV